MFRSPSWQAIRLAARRSDKFRFSYYLRSMSAEGLGKRCEQLMRACEREVEQLQKRAWEALPDEEKAKVQVKDVPIKSKKEQEAGERSAASRKRTEKVRNERDGLRRRRNIRSAVLRCFAPISVPLTPRAALVAGGGAQEGRQRQRGDDS